jgi:hypothetical protein
MALSLKKYFQLKQLIETERLINLGMAYRIYSRMSQEILDKF